MKKFEYKELSDDALKLDDNNVRFFHIKGYTPEESLLIIGRENIQRLVHSMNDIGFDGVFPLHADINNVVGDGNSRLLAFKISKGNKDYKWLVDKYKIIGFGDLKEKDAKLPVIQYLKNSDLDKYIRATHLVNEKRDWTTATRYAYFYKMYIDKIDFEFPGNIKSIIKNVALFNFSLNNITKKELKTELEVAYDKKIAMFERLLLNTKLMQNEHESPKSVNSIIDLGVDENGEIQFTDKITSDQFKEIIFEFAEYISKNPIGQKKLDIQQFPKTYDILNPIFNIKSTKPQSTSGTAAKENSDEIKVSKKESQEKKSKSASGVKTDKIPKTKNLFFLEENISKSFDELAKLEKTLAQGWRERILIENISWYLLAKTIKKIHNFKSWDFVEEGDMEKIENKYRTIFQQLIRLQETIRPMELTALIQQFNTLFKKDEICKGQNLFTNTEQKYIQWITLNHSLYLNNLNEAAHGRWSHHMKDELSPEFNKLLIKLINEFKKNW